MPHELINLSSDLKKLWDEGYEMQVCGAFLLISHVPYVTSARRVTYGTLVSDLTLAGDRTTRPNNHVAHFIGEAPCDKEGRVLVGILNASNRQQLGSDITIDHTFSSKPPSGYADYYDKMTTYITILSSPALSLDPTVKAKTFQVIEVQEPESPFNYIDTNSTRARISVVSRKLETNKIAIVGLGGTGSYILDLVAKTPVKEIHLYDGDYFFQHNAFRAPGAASLAMLRERIKKTDYFKSIYSNMHRGIVSHPCYVDASNMGEFSDKDFVFMCLEGKAKMEFVEYLENNGKDFIDVGLGVQEVDGGIIAIARVTASTHQKRDHFRKRVSFSSGEDNEYSTNIQIADLNSLNATLAVIKWKKLCGFYQDRELEYTTTYTVDTNQLLSNDQLEQ